MAATSVFKLSSLSAAQSLLEILLPGSIFGRRSTGGLRSLAWGPIFALSARLFGIAGVKADPMMFSVKEEGAGAGAFTGIPTDDGSVEGVVEFSLFISTGRGSKSGIIGGKSPRPLTIFSGDDGIEFGMCAVDDKFVEYDGIFASKLPPVNGFFMSFMCQGTGETEGDLIAGE